MVLIGRRKYDAGGVYRKFDGKKYHLFSVHSTRHRANQRKLELMNQGRKVRIVRGSSGYEVFMR